MVSLSKHCLRLKKSWNLYYFYFFLKSPQTHLLPLSSCDMGEHIPHFSRLCKDKLCSVWETRCSQGKTEDEEKNAEYFWNQKQELLNNFTTAYWRLLFARGGRDDAPEAQQRMQRSHLPLPPCLQFGFLYFIKSHLDTNHQLNSHWTPHLPLQRFPEVLLFPRWFLPLQLWGAQQRRSSWPRCRRAACPSSSWPRSGAAERKHSNDSTAETPSPQTPRPWVFVRTKLLYLIYNFNFVFFTLHLDSKLFLYNGLNLLHSDISSCSRPHMENKGGGSIYISIFEAPFKNRMVRNHYRVRSEGIVSSAHTHTHT